MKNFTVGLTLGVLLGGLGVAGAQFYPGMDPGLRDLQLEQMRQQQEQMLNMQRHQQMEQQLRPC
jgi:hypothetical protein